MTTSARELDALLAVLLQAHPWHGVAARAGVGIVNAFIEIVPTDTVKYELDKHSGHLRIDRPQLFSSYCPTLYGFVPQSYCGKVSAARSAEKTGSPGLDGDGDPLDICVLTEKAVAHGNLFVRARPIGGLRMLDGNEADDKIIAVLESDLAYGHLNDVSECPPGLIERLQHYFLSYKQRPDEAARKVRIAEVYGQGEAMEVIRCGLEDYDEKYGAAAGRLDELHRLLEVHRKG